MLLDTYNTKELLNGKRRLQPSGCPPCQGFSIIRRLNRNAVEDERNNCFEFLRFVEELTPPIIMLEKRTRIINYHLLKFLDRLRELGYNRKTAY